MGFHSLKRKKQTAERKYGLLWILLALIIMGIVGALLSDFFRYPFGNTGALVWMTITAVSLFSGFIYYAQFILPVRGNDGWMDGFLLLMTYLFKPLQLIFVPKPTLVSKNAEPAKNPNHPPDSFRIVDAGIIPGYEVLALAKGELFSRAAGPGYISLTRGERIMAKIDLRPHRVKAPIKANTRDGIPIETAVSITFRVKQETPPGHTDNLIYPFSTDAIFKVSSYASVDQTGSLQPWTKQLLPSVVALVNQELSNYTLDELQQSGLPPLALDEIKKKVKQTLQDQADPHGIEVVSVGLDTLKFPQKITDQRIKSWQAEWQRKIDIKHAVGDAEVTRRIKQAQARAQIEMIERITQSIDKMRQQEGTHLNEIITLRMIQALEEAMSEGAVQALIPQQVMTRLVMDASNQMQGWMARTSQGGDS